jgi:hypothetical protein
VGSDIFIRDRLYEIRIGPRCVWRLHLTPAFEGTGQGDLIGIFKVATDGQAPSKTSNFDTKRLDQARQMRLVTVGGGQVITDVIRLCGGENVFADLKPLAPQVTVEAVIQADPEVIVASGMGEARPEWLDDWRQWTTLTAVKRDNLFFIPPDLIQRHTPRLVEGAARLCEQLEAARGKRMQGKDGR